jgi:hypothetical protein
MFSLLHPSKRMAMLGIEYECDMNPRRLVYLKWSRMREGRLPSVKGAGDETAPDVAVVSLPAAVPAEVRRSRSPAATAWAGFSPACNQTGRRFF